MHSHATVHVSIMQTVIVTGFKELPYYASALHRQFNLMVKVGVDLLDQHQPTYSQTRDRRNFPSLNF